MRLPGGLEGALEAPPMGKGLEGRRGWGGGSTPPAPSPYGDHVCPVTVIAATAQVEEGRDVVRGHGGAHVPRDHSDPGGTISEGLLLGTIPLSSVSLPRGSF